MEFSVTPLPEVNGAVPCTPNGSEPVLERMAPGTVDLSEPVPCPVSTVKTSGS